MSNLLPLVGSYFLNYSVSSGFLRDKSLWLGNNANAYLFDTTTPLALIPVRSFPVSGAVQDVLSNGFVTQGIRTLLSYDFFGNNTKTIATDPYWFGQVNSTNTDGLGASTDNGHPLVIGVFDSALNETLVTNYLTAALGAVYIHASILYTATSTASNSFCVTSLDGVNHTIKATVHLTSVSCFYIKGNYLYVGCSLNGGFELYDITNPFIPVFVSYTAGVRIDAFSLDTSGCIMCASYRSTGGNLIVIDITLPAAPAVLSTDGTGTAGAPSGGLFAFYQDGFIIYVEYSGSYILILDATSVKAAHHAIIDPINNATIKNTIRLSSMVNHTRPISLLGKYKS